MKTVSLGALPSVSEQQMREVDRLMIEDFQINLFQMMENAGRNLADLSLKVFDPSTVHLLAGSGGNGGGGLVAARHLINRGVDVTVSLSREPSELAPVPTHQLKILARMGIVPLVEPEPADLILDALIGYSLRGAPTGRTRALIDWANENERVVLSLDLPSGLDPTTGRSTDPCVSADATMTIALPKLGLRGSDAVGDLYLADISIPAALYSQMGLEIPFLFREDTVVRLV
jgi:NAD(P)H-hydrate epimerase